MGALRKTTLEWSHPFECTPANVAGGWDSFTRHGQQFTHGCSFQSLVTGGPGPADTFSPEVGQPGDTFMYAFINLWMHWYMCRHARGKSIKWDGPMPVCLCTALFRSPPAWPSGTAPVCAGHFALGRTQPRHRLFLPSLREPKWRHCINEGQLISAKRLPARKIPSFTSGHFLLHSVSSYSKSSGSLLPKPEGKFLYFSFSSFLTFEALNT